MGSQRDKRILNLILNPNFPFINEELKSDNANEVTAGDDSYSHLPNYLESEAENLEGIKLAESGNLDEALCKFNIAIELCPCNPTTYNNRAQLFRLLSKIFEAMADLEKSLELSGGKGRIAGQSHIQKALIYRLQNEEESAKIEFEKATKLGSKFAQRQLIELNPYAAMCNKMLSEIMVKFRRAEE